MRLHRWIYAMAVLLVAYFLFNLQDPLVRIAAYRQLYRHHPFYVPEGIKTSLEIILCLVAVALALGRNFRLTAAELRLDRGFIRGALFALLATAPTAIGLAGTHGIGRLSWHAIAYLAFFAPFAEELVMRAYAFGQLHRRCGWPVWLAALVTGIIFGWGHIEKGTNFFEMAALFLITATGGVFFAWFFYRWDSIWFPFMGHALMNFYWELFSVSRTALGGWYPFAVQTTTILFAAFVTWRFAPPKMKVATLAAG